MMRFGILILILIATLFGSGYWYRAVDPTCRIPVHYRIGDVDSRFGTDTETLKLVAEKAEKVWEDPLAQDLFVYDPEAKLPINLVFDERQEQADRERELKEDLKAKEGMSESVARQYEELIEEFRKLKKEYETRVVAYEKKLGTYNDRVSDWNSKGEAPAEVIDSLHEEQAELVAEDESLETRAKKLKALATQLNAIGAQGNSLLTDYNDIIDEYNTQISEAHEFTQGDYARDAIHVYEFNSEDELIIVLAHEFGHALSLDHVENEQSFMYHLMGKQTLEKGITPEDRAEFARVCTDRGILSSIVTMFRSALSVLGV